ncbi:MAG TPA: DUF2292 domain-containing protein [Treponema sp.]|nr:DUF2292 domain-containing protein [Treponema sp.]
MGVENALVQKQTGGPYPPEFAKLAEYVKEIKYGSVTIQIQNSRIIQIDKNEKFRFDKKENQN